VFQISLEQVIQSAVRNNLSAQSASLEPAIAQSQLTQAEAVFDWVLYADMNYTTGDRAVAVPVVGGVPLGISSQASDVFAYSTGLRKSLTTGGTFTASQGLERANNRTTGSSTVPDPANDAFAAFALDQPLLRGFGSDVALSEVRIARNAERGAVLSQKGVLLDLVTETERAYWTLVRSRLVLQIRQRLLERGVETRDILQSRLGVDARPAEFSDAVARVESRRADVIRAQRDLRLASDELKRLINDPAFAVGDETLLVALDDPMEEPVSVVLVEALSSAIADRPEVQRSILAIDDASIRQTVARNARLPLLNFSVQTRIQGLDDDAGGAYQELDDFSFVQWLIGGVFEQPIGNRAGEAQFRQRQLERMRSVIDYRTTVQNAVLRVKNALREVQTQYALIGQTRVSRIAAAENLRTLLVLEKTIASLSPDFLDLKFRRQESLAQAEIEEVLALTNYNSSLAELASATGRSLDRNRIRFVVPDGGVFDAVVSDR
jgi:outer membrane protein TolC